MNKIYDKLLLALAVLALLAGVGFYAAKSGNASSGQLQVSTQIAYNPYQNVPVPESSEADANWPEPPEQSMGWVYDVFTPPKIFLDEDGRFSAEGWVPPPPPVPFGVYLAELSRKPYRLQIEGYIEEDLTDASKSLILLYDEELEKSFRARVGQEVSGSDFKVLDFNIERVTTSDGGIEKVATVKLLDERTNSEVVLEHGERLYEEGFTALVRSEEDPSVEIELTELGESFETDAGQYVLEQINLEESTVTVKKLGDEEREPETKRLSESAPSSTPIEESPSASEADTSDEGEAAPSGDTFDFPF